VRDKISVGRVLVEPVDCIIFEKPGHRPSCLDASVVDKAILPWLAVVNSVSRVFPSFPPGKVDFPYPILVARLVKVAGSV